METFQFHIKSDQDAFSVKRSDSEILINGIPIALDDIIELTTSSQSVSDRFVECDESRLIIATNAKRVTIIRGKAIYFGIGKNKESGASLFNALLGPIIEAVKPRLLFNTLKSLAQGNSLLVGPLKITREGLFTKKMFSDKFCSWDWNIRAEFSLKPLHVLSTSTGHNLGYKISFTSPETNNLEDFGFLKSNETNSVILCTLCWVLGKRNDELMYKMFQTGEEAESGGIPHLKRNIWKLKDLPESALKRRLKIRFPEIE